VLGESSRIAYLPALDGLRAVSILAVMLRHTGLLPGGFLGVDVFFTLSGFLITSLLLQEYEVHGLVSLRDFYMRRALRLLPALVPVVILAGGAMIAWAPGWDSIAFIASVVFYTANWAGVMMLPQGLLGHVWSLSIEEQFYAVWPPALLLPLGVVRRRGALALVLSVAAVLTVVYRAVLLHNGATLRRLYLGSDTHADPILIGCALALLVAAPVCQSDKSMTRVRTALGVVGLSGLLTIFALAGFPLAYLRYGGLTVLATAVATALVVLAALPPASRLATLLEAAPLVWIGRRPYGLYFWHFPVLYLADAL